MTSSPRPSAKHHAVEAHWQASSSIGTPGAIVVAGEAVGLGMGEELRAWLSGRGLGGHADRFADNGVDWDVLLKLAETDLEKLGLSRGDRKRLMKALAGLRQATARPAPRDEAVQPNLAVERRPIAEPVDRFDARVRRRLTPLVGREAELAMLCQRWQQARDSEMRCVMLVGESGMGKSRLIRALRDALRGELLQTVTWYCSSYYQNSAFFPVILWLCRALGIDPQDGGSVVKLKAAVDSFGIRQPDVTATLTSLLGLPGAEPVDVSEISGLQFKRKVLDTLATTIEAMAERQALLLAVEDAHWIDPSTLDLLGELQERLPASRLMLLITGQPEFKPDWKYPQFVQVSLDRLSRRERQAMVEHITGGRALPDFVLDTIVARTDGVPLFVEELTRTVLEGNPWRDAGTHYELEGPAQGVAIPDSLQDSLLARLDRLDPAAKELAQAGAAIGREFDRELVRRVARWDDAKLEAGLEELVAAEIVQPIRLSGTSGAAYAFRHALIRDAAYQALLLARRRQYHAQIAEVLAAEHPEMVAGQPEIVAQHMILADQVDQAIDALHRAGEVALRRGAYPEAYAHLERGLELVKRLPGDERSRSARALPLLLVRGRVEIKSAMIRSAATYREAADVARQTGRARELAAAAIGLVKAEQLATLSPTPEGIALVEEAIAANRRAPAELRWRLISALGRALMLNGIFDRAGEVTAQALRMAEELNDQRRLRE